jgi:two-component system, NtrC family, response regulator
MSIQKSFLRVIQERAFRPVGGKNMIHSDFRLIAATNKDLNRMIKDGTFREDLYFRIKALTISLPPLRERISDIKELTMNIILKVCDRDGIDMKGFSPEFVKILEAYSWPGNVRELINSLDRAISKAQYEPVLFPKHLPDHIRISVLQSSLSESAEKASTRNKIAIFHNSFPNLKAFRESLIAENEKAYLSELLELTNGDIKEACRISGLGRARIYGLMKAYGISIRS